MTKAVHFALPGNLYSLCGLRLMQSYKTSIIPMDVTCAYCRRYNLTVRAAEHARDTKPKE